MKHLNIEIKAKNINNSKVRDYLISHNADFKGTDHQIDTYFRVATGRLKLRQGNIENALVYYQRKDKIGPKQSHVTLIKNPPKELKLIMSQALGVLAVVDKKREIYFIDNVKFHLDHVKGLGDFMEVEAIGIQREATKLQHQCDYYIKELDIAQDELINQSYSDLIVS